MGRLKMGVVYIGQDLLVLQTLVAFTVLILLVILSFFELKGVIKFVVSFLLLMILVIHYLIVLYLLEYLDISIYPLLIVEHSKDGSAFYFDYGQLALIALMLTWREKTIIPIVNMLRCRIRGRRQCYSEIT